MRFGSKYIIEICARDRCEGARVPGAGGWGRAARWSAEAAGDVVFGLAFFGAGEDCSRVADLDEPAEVEERGALRNAGGLLHVVGHDDDREGAAELGDEVLDLGGGDGI